MAGERRPEGTGVRVPGRTGSEVSGGRQRGPDGAQVAPPGRARPGTSRATSARTSAKAPAARNTTGGRRPVREEEEVPFWGGPPPRHPPRTITETSPAGRRSARATPVPDARNRRGRGSDSGGPAEGRRPRLPIDPRFRQRVVAVRRQQGQRRLRLVVALVAVVVVVGVAGVAAYSPLLAVRHVRITTGPHVPRAQVLTLSGLGKHPPMIEVPAATIEARVDALPWVASTQVTRSWPSTVRIAVRERRAVGVVAAPGGVVEVDGTGRVLTAVLPSVAGLPAIAGAPAPPPPGSWLAGTSASSPRHGGLGSALTVAAALPAAVDARLASITSSPSGVVTLGLAPGPTTVTLGAVAPGPVSPVLADQVVALGTVLSEVDVAHIAVIDLTVPGRPALTPAGAS